MLRSPDTDVNEIHHQAHTWFILDSSSHGIVKYWDVDVSLVGFVTLDHQLKEWTIDSSILWTRDTHVLDNVQFAEGSHQDEAHNHEWSKLINDQACHGGDEAEGLEYSDEVEEFVERLEQQEGLKNDFWQRVC